VEWCRRNGRRNVARTRRTARAFGSNDVGWHAGRCIARVGRPAVIHLTVWSVIGNEPLRVSRRRDQGDNGNNGEARHRCTSRTRIAIWVGLRGDAEACVLSLDHLGGAGAQRRRHVERNSRNGRYGILDWDHADHSALMPANLITLAHFSVSSAMSLPNSAGEPASTVPPRSASRAFIFGSASAVLISLLSFSTITTGVACGAPTPNQKLAS